MDMKDLENELIQDELASLIEKARKIKKQADESSKGLKAIKEDLRIFMIDSGIKEYAGVEIRRGFSFDVGYFKMEYPELAKKYVQEETKTVTTTYDVFSKKSKEMLKEKHPDVFNDCNAENTPQVRGL